MTGIFYGSTMGTTEAVAQDIARELGIDSADVHNVAETSADETGKYDVLVLGSSTWGAGDLQDDWYDFMEALKAKDLSGKKVALFGCGDSGSYPDTFCGAVSVLHSELEGTGCTFIGSFTPEGYDVTTSDICVDGKFLGLAIDENDPSKNDERIANWCQLVKSSL